MHTYNSNMFLGVDTHQTKQYTDTKSRLQLQHWNLSLPTLLYLLYLLLLQLPILLAVGSVPT